MWLIVFISLITILYKEKLNLRDTDIKNSRHLDLKHDEIL